MHSDDENLPIKPNNESHSKENVTDLYDSDLILCICLWAISFSQGMLQSLHEHLTSDFNDGGPSVKWALAMSFLISNAVSNPVWGWICDKHGHRIGLLSGLVLSVFGSSLVAYAPNLTVCLIGRAVSGLCANLSLHRSYLGFITNGNNQARAFGTLSGIFGLAQTITHLLALIPKNYPEVLPSQAMFMGSLSMIVSSSTLFLCVFRLQYIAPSTQSHSKSVRTRHPKPLLIRYRLPIIAAFAYASASFVLVSPDYTLLSVFIDPVTAPYFLAIQGAVRTLSTIFVFPVLCARFGVVRLNMFGTAMGLITIPSVAVMSLIANPLACGIAETIAFSLRGVVLSFVITSCAVLINNGSPAKTRSRAVALSQSFVSMSTLVAVSIMTAIHGFGVDIGFPFLPFGVLMILCAGSTLAVSFIPKSLNRPYQELPTAQ